MKLLNACELVNKNENMALKERIPDDAYFENFVSLAKQIAPDGNRVTHVGLTLERDDGEKRVIIQRKKNDWDFSSDDKVKDEDMDRVEIRGTLRSADATKKRHGSIELVDQQNAIHKIKVPLGMMADIVRPMFDYDVVVKGTRDNRGNVFLEDIELQNDV